MAGFQPVDEDLDLDASPPARVEFVKELPPTTRVGAWDAQRRQQLVDFAAALKKRPGVWAKYPIPGTATSSRARASRINHGKVAAFAVGFRAVSRSGVTYVQYVAPPPKVSQLACPHGVPNFGPDCSICDR